MIRNVVFATVLMICSGVGLHAEPIVLCGADTVFVLETTHAMQGKVEPAWSWNAKQCAQLPETLRGTFRTTDDCKPLDGGTRVLISSSSGGCALVERPSGKVLWYAQVPNAHSVEWLPRNRIVAASSVHAQGNRLLLFDADRSDWPRWETPLVSAHGVVWDSQRNVLWALGLDQLQRYGLKDWGSAKPALALQASYRLPDEGGHDLQPVPRSSDLIATSRGHVYLFDRDRQQFRLHPELGDKAHVKSVNVHPRTGQMAYIQASDKAWWSDTLHFLAPPGKIQLPGQRLYKARW